MKVCGQFHAPAAMPQGKKPLGGWVGPRTGLDEVENPSVVEPMANCCTNLVKKQNE
jgi:hypothetical protein